MDDNQAWNLASQSALEHMAFRLSSILLAIKEEHVKQTAWAGPDRHEVSLELLGPTSLFGRVQSAGHFKPLQGRVSCQSQHHPSTLRFASIAKVQKNLTVPSCSQPCGT